MLNPISAYAIPEFVGVVPSSNPLNCTAFAGDTSTNFADLVVTGGCNSLFNLGVNVSENTGPAGLYNREWLARVAFSTIVRPSSDELEVTVELTHRVDPHPADGDAGGGPTYSVTFNCTAGGVCAGHTNSGAQDDTYKQVAQAILPHHGPSDHVDIFDSSFSVEVFKTDVFGDVEWDILTWRLEVTGRHIPEPSSLALLVVGVVALSIGRGRGLAQGVPQVSAWLRRRRSR